VTISEPTVLAERLVGRGTLTRNGERLTTTEYVLAIYRRSSERDNPAATILTDVRVSDFPSNIELGITVTLTIADGREISIYRTESGYATSGHLAAPPPRHSTGR
jgi:hypothetical protein